MSQIRRNKEYIHNLKVYYESTYAGGVVFYSRYLNFLEQGRTEMVYEQFGFNHQYLKKNMILSL